MSENAEKQFESVISLLEARQQHIRSTRELLEKSLAPQPALSNFLVSSSTSSIAPAPPKHYMTPLKRPTQLCSPQTEGPMTMPLSPRINGSIATTEGRKTREKIDAFYEGMSQRLEPCRCCEADVMMSSQENVPKSGSKMSTKSYELAIRSVRKELQDRIVSEMRGQQIEEGEISLEQLCKLTNRIKGKGAAENPAFAGMLWEVMLLGLRLRSEGGDKVPADLVHDVLLILAGTLAFDDGTAARALLDYLKNCGAEDLDREVVTKVELIIKESRVYFVDRLAYKPIRMVKESELNSWLAEHDQHFTFSPRVNRTSALLDSRHQSSTPLGKGTWELRYNSLMRRKQAADCKKEAVRQLAEEKKLEGCTFKPECILSARDWSKSREEELVKRLTENRPPRYTIDVEALKLKESESCTYRPEIIRSTSFMTPKEPPKDYYEAVARMKKKREELGMKAKMEEKHRAETGQRLARLRNMEFSPPSCLSRKKKPHDVVLHIEVAVYPGKVGRIGVGPTDDIEKLARNFCRAYSLNATFEERLKMQIKDELQKYLAENGAVEVPPRMDLEDIDEDMADVD